MTLRAALTAALAALVVGPTATEQTLDEAFALGRENNPDRAAIDQQTAAQRQAAAARIALDDIRLEVKAGARPFLDGLDAERDHLASRLQLDQAKADVVTTTTSLRRSASRRRIKRERIGA